MKQDTLVTRIVVILLLAAVLIYLGVSLFRGMHDTEQLVVTYAFEMDDDAALSGVIIRREENVAGRAALSEILPQEGERVSAGSTVALVYQDETAMADRRRARSLELELEQLRYAMRPGDALPDAKKLDDQLADDLVRLRVGASSGSLEDLEDWGLDIRSVVVKRTAQTDDENLPRLQAVAVGLESELTALNSASDRATRRIQVSKGGVFSGLADGFESVLTPESLNDLTVAGLAELRSRQVEPPADSLGKLITGSTWYFAADLSDEDAQRLEVGKRCDIVLSGSFNQEVSMLLERLGPLEDGRRIAVFSCNRYLNRVTLSRFVNARLVFERYSGVRIPDKALRVRTNADGSTTPGVYALVGRQVEFKAVEVIREGEGFYLVQGTDQNRKVLRPGDTVVVSSQELFEGKVVV